MPDNTGEYFMAKAYTEHEKDEMALPVSLNWKWYTISERNLGGECGIFTQWEGRNEFNFFVITSIKKKTPFQFKKYKVTGNTGKEQLEVVLVC